MFFLGTHSAYQITTAFFFYYYYNTYSHSTTKKNQLQHKRCMCESSGGILVTRVTLSFVKDGNVSKMSGLSSNELLVQKKKQNKTIISSGFFFLLIKTKHSHALHEMIMLGLNKRVCFLSYMIATSYLRRNLRVKMVGT